MQSLFLSATPSPECENEYLMIDKSRLKGRFGRHLTNTSGFFGVVSQHGFQKRDSIAHRNKLRAKVMHNLPPPSSDSSFRDLDLISSRVVVNLASQSDRRIV